MNDNIDDKILEDAANGIHDPEYKDDDGQGDADLEQATAEQPDAGTDGPADADDHDRAPAMETPMPMDGTDDGQDAAALGADLEQVDTGQPDGGQRDDVDRSPAAAEAPKRPRPIAKALPTLPRRTAPRARGMLVMRDAAPADGDRAEPKSLAEYKGDTDYDAVSPDGTTYCYRLAPAPWTKCWWEPAKHQIFAAQTDQRQALILDLAYSAGRAIADYPELARPTRTAIRKDAIGQFSRIASNFSLLIDPRDIQITKKIDEGIKAGVFADGEEIPEFLAEAIAEIPDAPEPTPAAGQEREHGSLSGFLNPAPDGIPEGTPPDRLPPAPVEVFPKPIRMVIDKVSATKCIPTEMTLSIILALVSACVGRGRGIAHRKEWREHANLFMILIAETGSGKSHAFKYIFRELLRIEAERKAKYKIEYRQYLEDMAAHRKSKDPEKKLPVKPVNVQYLLDDSTMEAASERMEDNPKGLFWSIDEMSGFFTSLDKYNRAGNDGKRRLLSAWNAEVWNTSRKSKDGMLEERYIASGAMGIFGGIQPHLLKSLFNYDDVKQGLPQRFIYVRAIVDKPMKMDTPEIPAEVDEVLAKITRRMIGLEMTVDEYGQNKAKYLTFEPDARAEIVHFGDHVNKQTFSTAAYDYAVKLNQILLRLSLILHILSWACGDEPECPDVISFDTALDAIALTNWLAEHTEAARTHFPGAQAARRGDAPAVFGIKEKLLEIITKMPEDERKIFRSREDVQALIGGEISKEHTGKALAALGITRKQVRESGKVRGGYYLSDGHLS